MPDTTKSGWVVVYNHPLHEDDDGVAIAYAHSYDRALRIVPEEHRMNVNIEGFTQFRIEYVGPLDLDQYRGRT